MVKKKEEQTTGKNIGKNMCKIEQKLQRKHLIALSFFLPLLPSSVYVSPFCSFLFCRFTVSLVSGFSILSFHCNVNIFLLYNINNINITFYIIKNINLKFFFSYDIVIVVSGKLLFCCGLKHIFYFIQWKRTGAPRHRLTSTTRRSRSFSVFRSFILLITFL